MARGTVNKVILIGRLGGDPELRYTPTGRAVANFRMATDEVWRDRDGNLQQRTEWHNIVMWDRQAEICGEYLRKGSLVYVEGRLQTREWEGQDGVRRRTTEIIGQRMQILSRREVEVPEEEAFPPEEIPTEEDELPF